MATTIFCQNSHLILDAARCPHCGWTRPVSAQMGQPIWNPVDLRAGLGGEGRNVLAEPAVVEGVAAFPLRNGELVGMRLADGKPLWRIALEAGRMTRRLVADQKNKRFLASVSDERMLEKAEIGYLADIEPQTGKLSPIWRSNNAAQLSTPTLTEDLILLRTSHAELIALVRQFKPEVFWRQPLQAWWPVPPVVSGEQVLVSDGRAMQGEGYFLAYALQNGQPLWDTPPATDGLLANAPVATAQGVIIQNHRTLMALDRQGKTLWQQKFTKLYTPPVVYDQKLFLVVRGPNRNPNNSDYRLQCLAPESGNTLWEMALPERVRISPLWEAGILYFGTDEGSLLAYDATTHRPLWAYPLGSHENPVQTTLTLAENVLLAGTYDGKIAALQVRPSEENLEAPEVYLEKGEYEAAAAAYVLQNKDFRKAAELYITRLDTPRKALAVLEHGQLYRDAGELARQLKMYAEAQKFFQQAEDPVKEIQVLREMGDERTAAAKAEQIGDFPLAAELYEKIGELRKAQELFRELSDFSNLWRLRTKIPLLQSDLEQLEKKGLLREAGEEALRLGYLEKAVDLFGRADLPEKLFEALQQLTEKMPETWSLQRLADLARKMGKFYLEAQTREKLKQDEKTADAYFRAAKQKEFNAPSEEAEIGRLYSRAAHYFAESGLEQQYQACFQKVVFYDYLPQIVVSIQVEQVFRVNEFNTMHLLIKNIGRGIAHDVRIGVGSNRFETQATSGLFLIKRLAPGNEKEGTLFVQPLDGQVGEAVPLQVEWKWQSRDGKNFDGELSTPVKVLGKDDSKISGPPIIIHAQTYTHVEGTYAARDVISGDQIHGDVLKDYAQKGDKVEINRGQGHSQINLQPESVLIPLQPCPNCKSPIEVGTKFCIACGLKMDEESKLSSQALGFYSPKINILLSVRQYLQEKRITQGELIISNIGNEMIYDLNIQFDTDRFEVIGESQTNVIYIAELFPHNQSKPKIFIRPLDGSVGETVPIGFYWKFKSQNHGYFENRLSHPVPVLSIDDDSTSTNLPINIDLGSLRPKTTLSNE